MAWSQEAFSGNRFVCRTLTVLYTYVVYISQSVALSVHHVRGTLGRMCPVQHYPVWCDECDLEKYVRLVGN